MEYALSDMNGFLLLTLLMLVAGVLGFFHQRIPKPFRERGCMGVMWKRSFPHAEAWEIRLFLDALVDAFDFDKKHRLLFQPADTFMDVYSAIYKHQWVPDNFEDLEFVLNLEESFGRPFPDDLAERDATLGEVFEAMRAGA
jgi:hypothetical protein